MKKRSSIRLDQSAHRQRSLDNSSIHSSRSGSSTKSDASRRSDVDRLIDAISGPLEMGEAEPEKQALQRSSRESGHSRKSASSVPSCSTGGFERPGMVSRSISSGAPEHLRQAYRAIRMPQEFDSPVPPRVASRVLFEIPDRENHKLNEERTTQPQNQDAEYLQVLVAEDDPVNSRIIMKRLEKSGHKVHHTVNGADCAGVYRGKPAFFDVVLMDMQVRILSSHFIFDDYLQSTLVRYS